MYITEFSAWTGKTETPSSGSGKAEECFKFPLRILKLMPPEEWKLDDDAAGELPLEELRRENHRCRNADGSAIKNGCAESNRGNAVCRNRKDSEIHPKADRETKGRKRTQLIHWKESYEPIGIICVNASSCILIYMTERFSFRRI